MKSLILITQVVASIGWAQSVPKDCFRFSDTVGNNSKGKSQMSNMGQVLTSEFRYDMRLNKILGCTGSGDSLVGLTFSLKTTTLNPPMSMELDSLGYRYGSNCRAVELLKDQLVSYLEVSYDLNNVNSFFVKTGKNTNILFGARQPNDLSKSWSFNSENQLIGLHGQSSESGINAIGVLIYQQDCAESFLGLNIDPSKGDSNFKAGAVLVEQQNADGTFQFASRSMSFKNAELEPKNVKANTNIWSFSNPNLVRDVVDWAGEQPNVYYVSAGAAGVLLLIVGCVVCCCRWCCGGCCCFKKNKVKDATTIEKELEVMRAGVVSKKKHDFQKPIKVSDVLNEQRTMEEISENDDPYATGRKLVTIDMDSNHDYPMTVAPVKSLEQLQRLRQEEAADQRRKHIESIIYAQGPQQFVRSRANTLQEGFEIFDNGKQLSQVVAPSCTPPETRDSYRRSENMPEQFEDNHNRENRLQHLQRGLYSQRQVSKSVLSPSKPIEEDPRKESLHINSHLDRAAERYGQLEMQQPGFVKKFSSNQVTYSQQAPLRPLDPYANQMVTQQSSYLFNTQQSLPQEAYFDHLNPQTTPEVQRFNGEHEVRNLRPYIQVPTIHPQATKPPLPHSQRLYSSHSQSPEHQTFKFQPQTSPTLVPAPTPSNVMGYRPSGMLVQPVPSLLSSTPLRQPLPQQQPTQHVENQAQLGLYEPQLASHQSLQQQYQAEPQQYVPHQAQYLQNQQPKTVMRQFQQQQAIATQLQQSLPEDALNSSICKASQSEMHRSQSQGQPQFEQLNQTVKQLQQELERVRSEAQVVRSELQDQNNLQRLQQSQQQVERFQSSQQQAAPFRQQPEPIVVQVHNSKQATSLKENQPPAELQNYRLEPDRAESLGYSNQNNFNSVRQYAKSNEGGSETQMQMQSVMSQQHPSQVQTLGNNTNQLNRVMHQPPAPSTAYMISNAARPYPGDVPLSLNLGAASSSVIELTSMAEPTPSSHPQRASLSPSATYFTK